MKGTVLLTGGSGFVGRALALSLAGAGWRVKLPLRGAVAHPNSAGAAEPVIETVPFPGLEEADWPSLLDGVDCVVHAAGLAHATETIPEERYRAVNTLPSLALAQAARGRVGRFVFLSSIRAQCGPTSDIVLTEDATARPTDAYGRSKLAAEAGLAALDLAAVSLRPVRRLWSRLQGQHGRAAPLGTVRHSASAGRPDRPALRRVAGQCRERRAARTFDRGTLARRDDRGRRGAGDSARHDLRLARRRRITGTLFSIPEVLIRAPLALIGKGDWAGRFLGSQTADPARLIASGWHPVHARSEEGLKAWMAAEALLTRA